MTVVRIYTDGASSPQMGESGPGGWAAAMFLDGVFSMGRYGGIAPATNNRMELQGLISGMEMLPTKEMVRCKGCGVVDPALHVGGEFCEELGPIQRPVYENAVIVSDSQYCVQGATKWVHSWQRNGWKTSDKKDVKNQDLWEKVAALARTTAARFEWVKGHGVDAGNQLADHFAVKGKKEAMKVPLFEAVESRISADVAANFLSKA